MTERAASTWQEPLRGFGVLAGHVAGVLGTSLGLMALAVGGDLRAVLSAWTVGELVAQQAPHVLGHLVLGALFWATLFAIGRAALRRFRGGPSTVRVVKLSRGTVVTETLIVLPVALLLYIGLVQLSINNIASTLANVATFHAGRAMWVWVPEVNGGRAGATLATALDKARIQAAVALTPVAAGDYIMDFRNLSNNAKKARAGLVAGQLPVLATDQGALVDDTMLIALSTEDLGGFIRVATRNNQAMSIGLDKSSFRLRSARKFTFAYLSTSIRPIVRNGRAGAQLNYLHFNSMPLVGNVFGTLTTVAGRTGYYASYRREFSLPEQFDANPQLP